MRGSECVEEGDGGAGEEPGQQQLAGQTGAPGDGGDGDDGDGDDGDDEVEDKEDDRKGQILWKIVRKKILEV